MLNFSITCPHGYRNIDADECEQCLRLEVAKIQVIKSVEQILEEYTDKDDSATRALVLTAAGHYVSMKMNKPEDSSRVLNGILAPLQESLPAPKEERLLAQQQFLTRLSYEALEPEENECLSFQTWGAKLSGWLRGKIPQTYKHK